MKIDSLVERCDQTMGGNTVSRQSIYRDPVACVAANEPLRQAARAALIEGIPRAGGDFGKRPTLKAQGKACCRHASTLLDVLVMQRSLAML
jgi:hypothetical protein